MKLSNMAAELRKHGLTVVETAGWATRGYAGQDLQDIRAVIWHHTATGRSAFTYSDAPTLSLCVNGRSDLPGPLCQIVLGRSGTVYLTAAGVGNHAGTGGYTNIPQDMGNHYSIGIEMESSGVAPFDWTEDQIRVAAYLGAALELAYLMHLPAELRIQIGHKEYSNGGKIDPAGWPGDMDGLRAQINEKIAELQGKPAVVPVGNVVADKPKAPGVQAGKYVADPHWLVEPNETLTDAADWAGVSVQELADFNGIKNINVVHVGERIWAPQGRFDTWTVDPGDTLSGVAAFYASKYKHNLTVDQLCNVNGINDVSKVPVGLRLVIPA